jgi:hydroxymethylpyrimidine pyrophosphatase-like HAD family hydrolase
MPEEEMTPQKSPEVVKSVKTAYLFDVDGVLTDPAEKRVVEEGLFDEIDKRLKKGEPVGLITGRSNVWTMERMVKPLLDKISDKSYISNLAVIGEMGGTWVTFDEDGKHLERKLDHVMPDELKDKVRALASQKYSDSMFYDETKETMITVEMRDGHDLDNFHERQEELREDIKKLLEEQAKEYGVVNNNIATDVQRKGIDKTLAAERFLQFIKDKNIKPGRFITFGDSKSDFEMADELERRGKKVEMIFVGDKDKLGEIKKDYQIEYVGGFTSGTLKYLQRVA